MLLSYRVSNYRSICEPVEIDFIGNSYRDQTQYEPYFNIGKQRILKGIGIFGANASGKSNILRSLNAFAYTILQSAYFSEGQTNESIVPFAFSEKGSKEPTVFDICFLFDSTKYFYHLALTRERIESETLSYSPNGRKVILLERNEGSLTLNRSLFNDQIRSVIRDRNLSNKPVVTFAAQFNIDILKNVYSFVKNDLLFISGLNEAQEHSIGALIDKDDQYRKFLVSLVKAADLSIDDVTVRKESPNRYLKGETPDNPDRKDIFRVYTTHQIGSATHSLSLEAESQGTLKVVAASKILYSALKSGSFIVFDEFGSSFHPDLTQFLLSLFFDSTINTSGAQILFATHDTRLLNSMILRRDEIYISERDADKQYTKLYPLSDFSARKLENIENGFLNGRYIAPPNIDEGKLKI